MRKKIEVETVIKNIALAGLAATGLFGALALYPLLADDAGLFYMFLTAHLTFAIHFWLPAVEIVAWRFFANSFGNPPQGGIFTLATLTCGGAMMAGGFFLGADNPLPIDYAPLFSHWLFLSGVTVVYASWLFNASIALAAWWKAKQSKDQQAPPLMSAGFLTASLAAWITLINAVLGAITIPSGLEFSYAFSTALYGAGHTIQFVHIPLMVTLWAIYAGVWEKKRAGKALALTLAVAAGFVVWTPFFYIIADPITQARGASWTMLLGLGLGTVSLIAGIIVLSYGGWAFPALVVSFACFLVGGWAPGLADRTALSLTGHYHGLLGAVTTACLILFYDRGKRWPSFLFGLGALVMAYSFASLSSIQLPRKTATIYGLMGTNPYESAGIIAGSVAAGIAVLWIILSGGRATTANTSQVGQWA